MFRTIMYFLLSLTCIYFVAHFKKKAWEKNYYTFVKPVSEKTNSEGKYNRTEFYVEFVSAKTKEHIVKEVDYDCYFNGKKDYVYSFREYSENFNLYYAALWLSIIMGFTFSVCFIGRLFDLFIK